MSSAESAHVGARTAKRRRGLPIGLVLLLVATVPVAGIGGLAVHAVQAARGHGRDATHVGELASDAVALTELDGAVFDEMVWSAVARLVSALDAPPELVAAFVDVDPTQAMIEARSRTDDLLAAFDRPSVTTAVQAGRVDGLDRRTIVARLGQAAEIIESALASDLGDLASAPHGETGDVPHTLEMLRLAVDARVAVAAAFSAYYSTVFDLRDRGPIELRRLIGAQESYEEDLASLAALSSGHPDVAAAVDVLQRDDGVHTFAAIVEDLITTSLRQGVADVPTELTAQSLTDHLGDATAAYVAATRTADVTLGLLDATATAVLDAARSDERAAHHDIVVWYWLSSALALATIGSAVLASLYIVRPVRRLHQAANDLRTGEATTACAPSGPAEVRSTALALRDAAAQSTSWPGRPTPSPPASWTQRCWTRRHPGASVWRCSGRSPTSAR